jgi:hypothetical protein
MKKFIAAVIVAAAVTVPIAATAGAASAAPAGPVTTTDNITMNAASEAVIDLPALNSQFTTLTINVNGTAYWGDNIPDHYWTAYTDGVMRTGHDMTSGVWGDGTQPDQQPLLLEHAQVGTVIYRVDGGAWHAITDGPVAVQAGKHVQVAYNDRPGS